MHISHGRWQRTYPSVQVVPDIVKKWSNKDKAGDKNHSKGCMEVHICAAHPPHESPEGVHGSKDSPCTRMISKL